MKEDDEGRPYFIHAIEGERLKGKFSYQVILKQGIPIELVQKELAWDLVNQLGIDTAWIHLLLLSYAAITTKENRTFCIPREEFYRCLGLATRRDLRRKDKKCIEILTNSNQLIAILNLARKFKEKVGSASFQLSKWNLSTLGYTFKSSVKGPLM